MALKRVLVTGASRGIGRSIALRLAESGWSIAIHFRSRVEEANRVASELGSSCSGVYGLDLADSENSALLISRVLAEGPLDAIVNNAGVYEPLGLATGADDAFERHVRRLLSINFESPLFLTRASVKHFLGTGHGKILNVASRVGFKGEPGAALYAASKAALINLTRSFAVEFAASNVGFFGIAPGWVDTAMAREGMEDRLPSILDSIPLGRMGSPEDCAAAVAFLLSDEAAYLSGEVIDINGASYFH